MSGRACREFEVVIVGAGPVGLLLAGLLGKAGIGVLVLEKRTDAPLHSQAIGVTPPSLRILARLNLDGDFVGHGFPIRDCHVHGESGWLGCASFRKIPDPHRFILSIPQSVNVRMLKCCVESLPTVALRFGAEMTGFQGGDDSVTVRTSGGDVSCRWLVGCDGHRSLVRDQIRVRVRRGEYGCHFLMGDFADESGLGEDAHLWFTADGAVEAFPVPVHKRRWIVQTHAAMTDAPAGLISEIVWKRTGITTSPNVQMNQSAFSPRWLDCDHYSDGRVVLCGDAAHLMSPIGGQGMNTGWADAEFLAHALTQILRHEQGAGPWLAAYERCRRRAARAATRRAEWGMWLGTRKGRAASLLRDLVMRHLLFQGPLARRVGPHFAMLTIPHNTTDRVPWQRLGLPSPTS